MIYKVLYQESKQEVPIRENTKTLYMEADSERVVRKNLADRQYNIEFIQGLEGDFLNYEKSSENFKMEKI
ncbi:DNA-dependent RNA polymerase auxiliary subunit epsilon [Scopulibacillus darangshiensis]|uniref:DNA-directed RNA polymerase subunit epsilon n=1 Tax=Scopulibacillus darangshiensis TaxID=442528 RepID=A0A4R2P8Z6_9BACL|nr:DNA-directed RNA polymerase subunit epsilon [Scopulibacillus darangshiensis]TCP30531.1 DNA-dependent RNA polymerase auxiliary subunit epsilon [Scopulibacillus darangshiensis]